jgi:hypothetical protein
MKSLKQVLTLSFALFLTSIVHVQCSNEVSNKSIPDIKFESKDIKEHIGSFESHTSIEVLESKIFENKNGTFLLSKARIDEKETWIYIMSISIMDNSARILDSKMLHACESAEISLGSFSFEEGEITGCTRVNHKILSKP